MLTTVGQVLVSKKGGKMSKESYARGFCKAAEAAGFNPVSLAKYAQSTTVRPPEKPKANDKYPGTGWDLMAEHPESAYLDNPKNRKLKALLEAIRGSRSGLPSGYPQWNSEHPIFSEPATDIPAYINGTNWSPDASNSMIRAGWKFPAQVPARTAKK